jgi:tRNA pseudouridine38-40 synthase
LTVEAGQGEAGPPEEGKGRLFRGLVAYDGGRFHGWQAQPVLSTVQGAIEEAILKVSGRELRIRGAGRTDAGVHALGQVMSFTLETELAPERLRMALNAHLTPEIRVLCLEEAPAGFEARFSATWRSYRYLLAPVASPFLRGRALVPRSWPDLERMRAAAPALLGEHDFHAFTTQPEGPYGCRVDEAAWEELPGGLIFRVRSNRFLYQMVRILVGTFLDIGRGRLAPEQMGQILERGDRKGAGALAPACGLYLAAVGYDPPWPARGVKLGLAQADLPGMLGCLGSED